MQSNFSAASSFSEKKNGQDFRLRPEATRVLAEPLGSRGYEHQLVHHKWGCPKMGVPQNG